MARRVRLRVRAPHPLRPARGPEREAQERREVEALHVLALGAAAGDGNPPRRHRAAKGDDGLVRIQRAPAHLHDSRARGVRSAEGRSGGLLLRRLRLERPHDRRLRRVQGRAGVHERADRLVDAVQRGVVDVRLGVARDERGGRGAVGRGRVAAEVRRVRAGQARDGRAARARRRSARPSSSRWRVSRATEHRGLGSLGDFDVPSLEPRFPRPPAAGAAPPPRAGGKPRAPATARGSGRRAGEPRGGDRLRRGHPRALSAGGRASRRPNLRDLARESSLET